MLVLALIFTAATVLWGFLIVQANGMSDNPSEPFHGGRSFACLAALTAALWLLWGYGVHIHIGT